MTATTAILGDAQLSETILGFNPYIVTQVGTKWNIFINPDISAEATWNVLVNHVSNTVSTNWNVINSGIQIGIAKPTSISTLKPAASLLKTGLTSPASKSTIQAAAQVRTNMTGYASSIPIGVFRGFGCGIGRIHDYETFLGRPVSYVLDFTLDSPTWAQFENGVLWDGVGNVSVWESVLDGRTLALGVPACCVGTSWSTEASGANDAHWTTLGNRLISLGLGNSILRIGREFNGSWYSWRTPTGTQSTYISGYQHVVNVLRSLSGANFKFAWNPYVGTGVAVEPTAFYPGDAYVDEIAIDIYDGDFSGNYPDGDYIRTSTQQQTVWHNNILNGWGLINLRGLAIAHNKPISYPEWGMRLWNEGDGSYHGGGDNPIFINYVAAWMKGTHFPTTTAWHALWEDDGMGVCDADNEDTRRVPVPQAREAFFTWFGS